MKPKHAQISDCVNAMNLPFCFSNLSEHATKQNLQTTKASLTYVDSRELVRLEAGWVLSDFLDNLDLVQGLDCHYLIFK